MIYTELVARLAAISHRGDLTTQMPNFVADATEKINRRFNLQLVAPVSGNDTNEVLTKWPLLYIYSGLVSLYGHLNNDDQAMFYAAQWAAEVDSQNINQPGTATDPWTIDDIPPAIVPV